MDVGLEVLGLTLTTNADAVASALRGTCTTDSYPTLTALAAARTLSLTIDDTLRALVSRARQEGATWQDIGTVLGTTRQAAYQRFGPHLIGDPHPMTSKVRGAASKALSVLSKYVNRDWSLRDEFSPTMAERLSAEMLDSAYNQVAAAVGDFRSFGQPEVRSLQGHTVVDVPMTFTAGEMNGRVVYDNDAQVAGFFILSPDLP